MALPEMMTRPEVAEHLRTPAATLAQWASKGYGPRFIKAGRRALYPRSEVERFISEQMDRRRGVA